MNQITVNFILCEPTPDNGYNIQYRVKGSSDAYTDAGNFTSSPAIFTDNANPDGTDFEGIIRADCSASGESGSNFGSPVLWSTGAAAGDPETANLFFANYQSGVFLFTLSAGIPSTDIVISSAAVGGYTGSTDCTSAIDEADYINSGNQITIFAGGSTGSGSGNTPMNCSVHSWKRGPSIVVNGITRVNGQTILIGGTTVTIVISGTCQTPYTC